MKVRHRRIPQEGVRYDGSPESIQKIRNMIVKTTGYDFVEIDHARPENADAVEVDNVVMLDFQKLYLRNTQGIRTAVERGYWVLSMVEHNSTVQILVMTDPIFQGNFEIINDAADLSKDQST